MSNPSWIRQLDRIRQQAAETKTRNNLLPTELRVAIVGVGSELNGDDAAGIEVVRRLNASTAIPADFLAIEAGSIPENASGALRRFHPDLVIFVDAADQEDEAGKIFWLEKNNIDGMSASSHTLPLTMLGGFLENELACQVEYLGIQPQQLEFYCGLSPTAKAAVNQVVRGFKKTFFMEKT